MSEDDVGNDPEQEDKSNDEDSPNNADNQREIFKSKKVTFYGRQSLMTIKAEHQLSSEWPQAY